jgi:hypothetical protein
MRGMAMVVHHESENDIMVDYAKILAEREEDMDRLAWAHRVAPLANEVRDALEVCRLFLAGLWETSWDPSERQRFEHANLVWMIDGLLAKDGVHRGRHQTNAAIVQGLRREQRA